MGSKNHISVDILDPNKLWVNGWAIIPTVIIPSKQDTREPEIVYQCQWRGLNMYSAKNLKYAVDFCSNSKGEGYPT